MSDLIRALEALTVGPDEVLIVKLFGPDWEGLDDATLEAVRTVVAELDRIGLGERSLVFVGDVEFTKVRAERAEEPLANGGTQ